MRGGADATACGLNHERRRRRSSRTFLGWVMMTSEFETVIAHNNFVCQNCLENLTRGTGPGAA